MEAIYDSYPVYEPNQVLANTHLNQGFDYLDEQERLTRANLIGIGIVCGLEIRLETSSAATTIHLSRGCGVTSQGYLIVEPSDVTLVSYRQYTLPADLDYLPFKDIGPAHTPDDLWELFPAREPGDTLLGAPADFLKDKVVVLFLELKKEGLRNCSPNNCDDRGAEVAATTRRLLIKVEDLNKILAAANQPSTRLTPNDLERQLLARLKLPDLRLPRFDVPNSQAATTQDIFAAFLAVFQADKLVRRVAKALSDTYEAFKPVVQEVYPANPFGNFAAKFEFLDDAPANAAQVRFLQYYYDFFDDLLKAYEEFRWKGAELMCACCPPEGLFPRHLMLGALFPDAVVNPQVYRHLFLASPATSSCEKFTKELMQLFRRMVEMIARFSNKPKLADVPPNIETDLQIRITPSKLGDVLLSDRAIPYYYHQDGAPPLFELWNAEKTRRHRANQNLSYRSDEYHPAPPAFVTEPLRYDLEPYNFLRIEGHLGKNYQTVLETLLSLRARYRLPVEIIALRAGVFDERISIDLSKEDCRFQDLETLYDTLREEFLSALCEGVMYLYDVAIPRGANLGGIPQLPLLKKYAPNFRHAKGTVGAWYEEYLALFQSKPYIDVDQNKIDVNAVLTVYCFLFSGTKDLPDKYFAHAVSIYYLMKLAEVLPASLDALAFADFENKYQDLMGLIRFFRSEAVSQISDQLKEFVPQEELIDHFDHVLFAGKLEPIRAVHEEQLRRIREVKQKQFLSFFLQKNPGIQHKAGVPLGGTFILAYHEEPARLKKDIDIGEIRDTLRPSIAFRKAAVDTAGISNAFNRISHKTEYARDPDIVFLLGAFTGQVPDPSKTREPGADAEKIIEATVKEITDEPVIADFYLPYICCSDCPPVQFTLPKTPPTFTVAIGCTNADDLAQVTVTPKGGVAPYTCKVDDADELIPLTGKLLLKSGLHTIVILDSAGTESAPSSVTIPGALTIGQETYTEDGTAKTYQVRFTVSGGKTPYTADTGTLTGAAYVSPPVQSEEPITIKISDSVGCSTSKEFKHTVAPPCDLPCDGIALRCGYRLWLPEPEPNRPYRSYGAEVPRFAFEFPQGNMVDLNSDVNRIIQAAPDALNGSFNNVVQAWLKRINALIAGKTGTDDWLRLGYSKSASDPIGTLWIEYFQCLKFEFFIRSFFQRPETREQLDVLYTPEGTHIRNMETKIPPFNCIEIDKCNPERPQMARCREVDLTLKIIKSIDLPNVRLDVEHSGSDTPVAFLWEVQDGNPALSSNKRADFNFTNIEPSIKTIRLTAFTERGCSVSVVDSVNLRPRSRRRKPN